MLLTLPPELLYEVISCLLPATSSSAFPSPPATPGPKALLALTLVCKTTYYIANEFLVKHCLHFETAQATECLANGLLTRFARDNRAKNGFVLEPTQVIINIPDPTRAATRELPPSLFDQHANAFDTLFSRVGHCLKRLALHSVFHMVTSWGNRDRSRPAHAGVYKALKQLTALEEFYCTWYDKYFSDGEIEEVPIWTHWPKLQRLGIAQVTLSAEKLLESFESLNHLTHLFLLSPQCPSPMAGIPRIIASGPRSLEKFLAVRLAVEVFETPSPPKFDGTDKYIEITEMSRLDTSKDSRGRRMVTGFLAFLSDEVDYWSCFPLWFLKHAQEGTLWDVEPTKHIKREFDLPDKNSGG